MTKNKAIRIKFGTDGWRGLIGEALTTDNVARVSAATARALSAVHKKNPKLKKKIVVGWDHRFLSESFALTAAKVFKTKGFSVCVSKTPVSTPAVSLYLRESKCLAGVQITASHNPPSFNGYKVKVYPGVSASPTLTRHIESLVPEKAPRGLEKNSLPRSDLRTRQMRKLKSFLDLSLIRKSGLRIAVDSMHGTGGTMVAELLRGGKTKVKTLHAERDPAFGGIPPEPTADRVRELCAFVRKNSFDLGIATDGDADRIALTDGKGRYVSAQYIMALLAHDLLVRKKTHAPLAKTYASTEWLDRIAESVGVRCFVTPIGFKYVAELMLSEGVLLGGEESGGIGVSSYMPERDGVALGLMAAEIMARRKLSLKDLIAELHKLYGPLYYKRLDLPSEPSSGKARLRKMAKKSWKAFAGYSPKISRMETLDGVKFFFEDGAWILFRQSGTEALLRTYAEAPSVKKLNALFRAGERAFRK